MSGVAAVRRPRGILFDLDGVLVQTEPLKALAHHRAVGAFGGVAEPDVYAAVMGRSFAEVRAAFLERVGVRAAPEAYERTFTREYERLLGKGLEASPGVLPLLHALAAEGYRLAVVSSSRRWMVEEILTALGLSAYFDVSVSADDVVEEKPAPTPYLRALEGLGLAPAHAVALEDTPTGVLSARGAGVTVVGVRHPYNAAQDLGAVVATLDSLEDTHAVLATIRALLA